MNITEDTQVNERPAISFFPPQGIELDSTPKFTNTLEQIVKCVCNNRQFKPDDLFTNSRKRELVLTRQMAHYFGKKYTKQSLSSIGSKIGGKDHATVLYSNKTVLDLMDTNKAFKREVEDIEEQLLAYI